MAEEHAASLRPRMLSSRTQERTQQEGDKENAASLLAGSSSETTLIPMRPWSAVACGVLSAISLAVSVGVLSCSTLERVEGGRAVDPSLSWHARSAMLLIVQSVILEVCILISSYTAVGIAGEDLKPKSHPEDPAMRYNLAEHNFGDSVVILIEYIIKFFTAYHFMFPDDVVAYKVALASQPRYVFPVRHTQWCFGVPLLVLLTNRMFLAGQCSQAKVWQRSAPSLVLTVVYCMSAYAMEHASGLAMRNLLIGLTIAGYLLASFDQVMLALSVPNANARGTKMAMLCYQMVTFFLYVLVYFGAYFGFIGCQTEQSLYTYMDASVKVLHGCFLAMIRNYEDIRTIRLWWTESVAARRDFERLVHEARVPIFTIDLQGQIVGWNGSVAQITGLSAEAVQGQDVLKLIKQECHATFKSAITRAAAAASGNVNSTEIIFRRNPFEEDETSLDGPAKPKKESATVVISIVKKITRWNKVEGYVAIGQDVSEICELKAVEQKKVQLMAVVSHELRSPLHGMIGLTNMLEQSLPEERHKKQVGMVRCCANRLLDLVTNVMEMTEAEQRQRKGVGARDKKTLVNFLDVAEEVVSMTLLAVNKAGKPLICPEVQLRNLLPELREFPVVLGNPYKCTQLLYNLVTNACKFTKQGTVTLQAKHLKDVSTLEISVEDTGAGISKEGLERIFQPFEQDHGSTADSRSFQGMGLGLAVCKETVRLHRGSIRVTSEPGKGSTFVISLPCEDHCVERSAKELSVSQSIAEEKACLAVAAAPRPAPAAAPQAAPQEPRAAAAASASASAPMPSATRAPSKAAGAACLIPTALSEGELDALSRRPLVLSVDDDEVNQEVILNSLNHMADIQRAMNGQEALDFLKKCVTENLRLPDLVLLDIQMPGLTGYEVLAEIRQKYTNAHTKLPVIMVSAKAPYELVALKCYADGCSDFLSKPFHTDLLVAKVDTALQVKKEIKDYVKAVAGPVGARSASKESAIGAAAHWEEQFKASQEQLNRAQESLSTAEQSLNDAEQRARRAAQEAEDATARARSERDRVADVERELAKLREELTQSRLAARANNFASEASTRPTPTEIQSPAVPLAASPGGFAQPWPPVSRPTLPLMMPPSTVTGTPLGTFGSQTAASQRASTAVPWLYEQLANRDQEIAMLSGRLATESSARELAVRQLDGLIQAAHHSKALLGPQESPF